jgi:hypothetical protein
MGVNHNFSRELDLCPNPGLMHLSSNLVETTELLKNY